MSKVNKKRYEAFTMVEMLITMAVLMIIFLAVGSLVSNMITTSNTVSSRMLVREESEYLAEVFRKYIRNSSVDSVKLYTRGEPKLEFENFEVTLSGDYIDEGEYTEIHFRPSVDSTNKVVCIGFFRDAVDEGHGYLVKSVGSFGSWLEYNPLDCFSGKHNQTFRKNFVVLNSDLVSIDGFSIQKDESSYNIYYSIDIDVRPVWGLGGFSNYRDSEGAPKYRKSFVIQTRRLQNW